MKIGKHFEFEASHILPKHPGKCSRMHGHSYKLIVIIDGSVDKETGMVVDFAVLSDIVKEEIINKYDHRHMNDYFENPTAENMAQAFFDAINEKLESKTREFLEGIANNGRISKEAADKFGAPPSHVGRFISGLDNTVTSDKLSIPLRADGTRSPYFFKE